MKQVIKNVGIIMILSIVWVFNSEAKSTTRILTDEEIEKEWDGIKEEYMPENVTFAFEEILSEKTFNELFPMRNGPQCIPNYYSYEHFKEAVSEVSKLKYKLVYRKDRPTCYQIYRLNKISKEEILICESSSFNSKWVTDEPEIELVTDMGEFLTYGNKTDRQKELAAFLAVIVGETEGNGADCKGGEKCMGLYFNEELMYQGLKTSPYSTQNESYPPRAGKSYHGRGPMQITWNYNYGLISGVLFGDRTILLNNPERVTENGILGFMTAIAFWMLPQGSKPSCHEVMTRQWKPTEKDITAGRKESCFGVVIAIIRGNKASNRPLADPIVGTRARHYQYYTKMWGIDTSKEKVDTWGMLAFR